MPTTRGMVISLLSSPRKRGPIVPQTPASGIWIPAFAGMTASVMRRLLPPPRPPAAAHAGAAGGGARAGAVGLGFLVGAGTHLVEAGFSRAVARPAARNRNRLGGGIVDHRELGGAQALDLVAQPRGLLEVEVSGGLAHARLEVGDHRLEIMSDGGGVFLADAGEPAAGGDQHMVALVYGLENIGDALAHALRRDAVGGVERRLLLAAAVGLGDRTLHRAGDGVGIEDHAAVDVARGTADGLHQRGLAAQKAFLVGVEDGDQRAFRNVEAFPQKIDPDQ